jgi:hypothetical protein
LASDSWHCADVLATKPAVRGKNIASRTHANSSRISPFGQCHTPVARVGRLEWDHVCHGIATCACVDRLNAAVPVITNHSARSVWERSDLTSEGARSFPFNLYFSQDEQTSQVHGSCIPSSVFHRLCLVGPILAWQHVGDC